MFYFQTIFCHVILFRVAHSFPRLRVKFHACFSSYVWVTLYTLVPDCHRQHNPIVIAFRTRLSSPVQTGCHCYENQIVNTIKPVCHRQQNPIVINSTPRLSLLSESDGQRHATRLSSPVQPDCYRYENQIVIAIKPDCHRRYNPTVIASTLSTSPPNTVYAAPTPA
jgi:hypothetical protein